jgi:hypothetical protein
MARVKFSIDRAGARFAIDDQGKVVWLTGSHRGMQAEFARRADAEAIIATYTASSRSKMRVVEVR